MDHMLPAYFRIAISQIIDNVFVLFVLNFESKNNLLTLNFNFNLKPLN